MSAPFGRVVDRHIKLFRYRTHPVVASGEKLKEPLLHLVASKGKAVDKNAQRRRQKSKSQSKKKAASKSADRTEMKHKSSKSKTYSGVDGLSCPKCGNNMITKTGPRDKKCDVCRHQWV